MPAKGKKTATTLEDYKGITFTRSEVAKILNCTPLTVSNREKKKIYPAPARNASSNFRVYSLADVLLLQLITFGRMQVNHIYAHLYDKGYTDPTLATYAVNDTIFELKKNIDAGHTQMPQVVLLADGETSQEGEAIE